MSYKTALVVFLAAVLLAGFLAVLEIKTSPLVGAKTLDDPLATFIEENIDASFQYLPSDYIFGSRVDVYPTAPALAPAPTTANQWETGGTNKGVIHEVPRAVQLQQENPELQSELLKYFDYDTYYKNAAPTFTSLTSSSMKQGTTGDLLSFIVTATDAENDPLQYYTFFLPSGAVFDQETQTFSWTPGYLQFGDYPVLFLVTDGQNTAYANVMLEIGFSLF